MLGDYANHSRPLAWVSVCGEIYILECVGAGFIRVEPLSNPEDGSLRCLEPEAKFQVHYIPATWDKATARAINRSQYLRPRPVTPTRSFEQAIRGPDLYAGKSMVKGPMFRGFVVPASRPILQTIQLKIGSGRLFRGARCKQ